MFRTSSFCQSDGCVSVGQFATSSYCNSDGCVAVGQFAKSSFSGSINCLEAGQWDSVIIVKDSKFDERGEVSPLLSFAIPAWDRFIDRVKQGVNLNFASYQPGDVMVWHHAGSDQWFLCRSGEGVELVFDKGEWDAFVEGVMANEFDTIDIDQIAA